LIELGLIKEIPTEKELSMIDYLWSILLNHKLKIAEEKIKLGNLCNFLVVILKVSSKQNKGTP